jgi:hypothetical protein
MDAASPAPSASAPFRVKVRVTRARASCRDRHRYLIGDLRIYARINPNDDAAAALRKLGLEVTP